MIYLQLSLLALGAILLNYNIIISMLCIVIFLLITWKNKNLNARKTIICVIVFLAFFIRGAYEQKNNITHLGNVENKNLELAVSDRFDVNGAYVSSIGSLSNEKVLVSYIVKSEDEKKFFKEKFWGGKLLVNANIEDVSEKTNFYSFDYKKYNENRGIFKKITINEIYEIKNIDSVYFKFLTLRNKLSLKINKELTFDKSGYFQALIFGDKGYLLKDDINSFKNLGTSHLLAISGLHIGILISLIYFILLKFRVSVDYIEKFILIIIPLYMLLSGASASVLRAGFMIVFYILLRRKNIDKLGSLLLTFLILLIYNPLLIFNIGFQLSFLITFCLLMSGTYIKNSRNKIYGAFRISLISTLGSIPILLYNFYTITYISVFSNIILVPIFSIVIFPLVIFSYIVFLINGQLFNIICRPILNITFNLFDKIQELFLIARPIRIGKLNIFFIIIIFIIVLTILINLNKSKYMNTVYGVLGIILICIGTTYTPKTYIEDVKIGKESVLYIRERKNNLLINTSNNIQNFYTDYRKKDKDYDIINQYDLLLDYEGKNKFEYLFLTSAKKNKSGYSIDLLARNLVGKVIVIDSLENKLSEVKNMAQYKKIDYIVLKENTEMKFGENSIYYYNKKVRVKNKNSEFEIEVDN
ncbi:ComEC/Rec2 family competence protein [Gemella parahaemolysans]